MPRPMGERSGLGPATPAEQRTEPDDVRYIHEPVRRIWRYVVARGRRRDGLAEGRRYCTDIGNIPEAVIVDIPWVCICSTGQCWVRTNRYLGPVTPTIVIRVAAQTVACPRDEGAPVPTQGVLGVFTHQPHASRERRVNRGGQVIAPARGVVRDIPGSHKK